MTAGRLDGRRLLGVFAHPDDETYSVGGCIARYATEGCVSTILTFTRGEAGQINPATAVAKEDLGDVRERELREACRLLGCEDVRIVGTPDSGTTATPSGIEAIVDVLRELRPDVVVTMEPGGVTRHPDHIAVSEMTTAAVERVRDEGFVKKLYLSAISEAEMNAFNHILKERDISWTSPDDPLYPKPAADQTIACVVDAVPWLSQKVEALRAHATQADEFIGWLPEDVQPMILGAESFQRPWPPRAPGEVAETDLFAGIA